VAHFLVRLGRIIFLVLLFGLLAWCVAALWFDGRPGLLPYLAAVALVFWRVPRGSPRLAALAGVALVVLIWWWRIPPTNDADWQSAGARVASAVFEGDRVTVKNVRNFNYRSDTDYTVQWDERTYDLSKIRALDFYISHWGAPIAHTMISFVFEDGPPLCASIEVRKKNGQEYSAIGGFFRQFELIYTLADERDVIRVRTNFRDERVRLYRLSTSPARARQILLSYLASANRLAAKPQWYNAATSNCTTDLVEHFKPVPWDYRILFNDHIDAAAYEWGALDRSMPFKELHRISLIDERAKAAPDTEDFWQWIRVGLPRMTAADLPPGQ
jgi:hypothetical protein